MLILSQKSLKRNAYNTTLTHLIYLTNYLQKTKYLPQGLISENLNSLTIVAQEIIFNDATCYKGVKFITKAPGDNLAIIGLLKSLYLIIEQMNPKLLGEVKKNIYQLEQIVKKFNASWLPFVCSSAQAYKALDLLESRILSLEQLQIGRNPLLINSTKLKNPFYFAHYLPYCNYINLYCIRNPGLFQELIFHEIAHLLIFAHSGNSRKLPKDYLNLSTLKTDYKNQIIEEFCDNFSQYILNKPLNPLIINFFNSFFYNNKESRQKND